MRTRLDLQPHARAAFRAALALVTSNFLVSVGTLLAVVLARYHAVMVDLAVGGRVVGGVMSSTFASRAAWGVQRALRRLRVVAAIMTVTAVPPLLTPGLPDWLKMEQATCGLLMLGVFLLVSGRHLRPAVALTIPGPRSAHGAGAVPGDPADPEERPDDAGHLARALA
jgi:hypothetical protein